MSPAHLSVIEAGGTEPSLEVLEKIAAVLGADLSVRLFPNAGPRVRDHIQLAMGEVLLSRVDPRWVRRPEVPVYRPVRGVIDLVLEDSAGADTVASEMHSQLHRVEQLVRWANQKAGALAAMPSQDGRRVCRLLVLRNCASVREVVAAAPVVFAAAYPGRTEEAVAALTGPEGAFPGAAIAWVDVRGAASRLMAGPPRGIAVGR